MCQWKRAWSTCACKWLAGWQCSCLPLLTVFVTHGVGRGRMGAYGGIFESCVLQCCFQLMYTCLPQVHWKGMSFCDIYCMCKPCCWHFRPCFLLFTTCCFQWADFVFELNEWQSPSRWHNTKNIKWHFPKQSLTLLSVCVQLESLFNRQLSVRLHNYAILPLLQRCPHAPWLTACHAVRHSSPLTLHRVYFQHVLHLCLGFKFFLFWGN